MHRLRALTALTIVALWTTVPLLASGPAQADAVSGTYVSAFTSFAPGLPANVTVSVPPNGESVTVENPTDTPLYILGYNHSKAWPSGEPYLEITKDGVFENTYSPAVYLNTQATIGSVPATANANRQPQWKPVPGLRGDIYQWHDHRIHWMGSAPPPEVASDPDHPHLISTWKIPYVYGDLASASARHGALDGTLTYEPGSHWGSYLIWIVIGLAVAGTLGVQIWLRPRRRAAGGTSSTSDASNASDASGAGRAADVTRE